jgi:hypothetical protein
LVKVRTIPDSIREAILSMYLEKCKQQNAVEFFDWHRKVFGAKKEEKKYDPSQQFVINLRLSRIKRHENNLFQNTEEIMQKELKNYEEQQNTFNVTDGFLGQSQRSISSGNTNNRASGA